MEIVRVLNKIIMTSRSTKNSLEKGKISPKMNKGGKLKTRNNRFTPVRNSGDRLPTLK